LASDMLELCDSVKLQCHWLFSRNSNKSSSRSSEMNRRPTTSRSTQTVVSSPSRMTSTASSLICSP